MSTKNEHEHILHQSYPVLHLITRLKTGVVFACEKLNGCVFVCVYGGSSGAGVLVPLVKSSPPHLTQEEAAWAQVSLGGAALKEARVELAEARKQWHSLQVEIETLHALVRQHTVIHHFPSYHTDSTSPNVVNVSIISFV